MGARSSSPYGPYTAGGGADVTQHEHGSFIDSLSVGRWKAPTPPACHQLDQGRNPDVRPLAEGLLMTELPTPQVLLVCVASATSFHRVVYDHGTPALVSSRSGDGVGDHHDHL